MKEIIAKEISKVLDLNSSLIANSIEEPSNPELGDYSFPCFSLSKILKKNPVEIALDLSRKISPRGFEKIEVKGGYLNFFIDKTEIIKTILSEIQEKEKYGSQNLGKNKTLVIDMSSPNIAKPFGIGHLRSTIIGNSLSEIHKFLGWKVVKINYLGDWGTQFGKLIVGYKKWGNSEKLSKNPISHLQELYIKVNADESLEQEARDWFKKLEEGNDEALGLWELFRSLSLEEFNKIYSFLGIKFDRMSGESEYNGKMEETIFLLKERRVLKKDAEAEIIDLEEYNLGKSLIRKSDGATLYITRDLTAAIDRQKTYHFDKMIYEVGSEQNLHFRQLFKILEILGFDWAKYCIHVEHGLYLDKDGKKFATRKGKTVLMSEVFEETISIAKSELEKRFSLSKEEIELRSRLIALSAIFYGDLKNYRAGDSIFDIDKFVSFEGDTGPYLLYTYARAKSILEKSEFDKKKKYSLENLNEKEKSLVLFLGKFPEVVKKAYEKLDPSQIAHYAFQLSQKFNEFYHSEQVIGSENEQFRLVLVDSFSKVLKSSLNLLGIETLEKM